MKLLALLGLPWMAMAVVQPVRVCTPEVQRGQRSVMVHVSECVRMGVRV